MDDREQQRQAVEACLAKMNATERRLLLSVHAPGDSVARIASETGQDARRLYTKINGLRSLLQRCVETALAGSAGGQV